MSRLSQSLLIAAMLSCILPSDTRAAEAVERRSVASMTIAKEDFEMLPTARDLTYIIGLSPDINEEGRHVDTVDTDEDVFWTFDPGPDVTVTIELSANYLLTPARVEGEGGGAAGAFGLFAIRSGSLVIKGPDDEVPDLMPKIGGFFKPMQGGAVFEMSDAAKSLTLSGLWFEGNTADGAGGSGGVLDIDAGTATLDRVRMDFNSAKFNGGAINATGESKVTIRGGWFRENEAGDKGGNINFSGSRIGIKGSLVAGGLAGDRGGNLNAQGAGKVSIRRTIFFDGVGETGDGVYTSTRTHLSNSMVWAASNCNGIRLAGNVDSEIVFNDINNNNGQFSAATFDGGGGWHLGNAFGSFNLACPREEFGVSDSFFNVLSADELCGPLYETEVQASPMTGAFSAASLYELYPDYDTIKLNAGIRWKEWNDVGKTRDIMKVNVWGGNINFQQSSLHRDGGAPQGDAEPEPSADDNCSLTDINRIARPQDADGDGEYGCDAGPFEQQAGPDIGPGQSGAFFDLNRDGEGIFVQMLGDGRAVVYVFSYTPDREQMWLVGVGEVHGNSIWVSDMLLPSSSPFGPGYDPSQLVFDDWGRMSVHWPTCAAPLEAPGVITFSSTDDAYGRTRYYTGRLTQPVACPDGEQHPNAGWSGNYYIAEENGHGIVVEILPDGTVVMIWYLFDEMGKARWVLGTGMLDGDMVEINDIELPTGGIWGDAFDPADITRGIWGSVILKFTCSGVEVTYDSIQGARVLDMTKLISLAGTTCTD